MNKVTVEYQCTHISCRNPKCYKSKLILTKEKFDLLHQAEGGERYFRSPSRYCVLGSIQKFEIISQQEIDPSRKDLQLESYKEDALILQNDIDNLTNGIKTMTSERSQKIEALINIQKRISELKE